MITDNQVIHLMEEFKIPFTDPYCPEDWKDWYHYILYDPATKTRFLYNLCFNGRPGTGYVTETVFLTVPKNFIHGVISDPAEFETYGYARNLSWDNGDLDTFPFEYVKEDIFFSIINNHPSIHVFNRHAEIGCRLNGAPYASPVYVPELAPYGNGFIGWGVIPGNIMYGRIWAGKKVIAVDEKWYCYHDRNFGRFNWGNIGWTWFALNARDEKNHEWTFVLHRSNNSNFTKIGAPILFVYHHNRLRKIFIGNTIDIDVQWQQTDKVPPILPGAMASVFSDRSLLMPIGITVTAADEKDYVFLKMKVSNHTEMIVPDSERKRYAFLKELSGSAETLQSFNSKTSTSTDGFFYAEYVH